ncbi:MAG: hypothetical protein ACI8XO_000655 [Verrucomicrobiales bacterium]|jgi:hypothetical protein
MASPHSGWHYDFTHNVIEEEIVLAPIEREYKLAGDA